MVVLNDFPQLDSVRHWAKQKKAKVFLVGGFLRDWRRKQPLKDNVDYDFAVEQGALEFARSFARHIKGAFVLLDTAHGSARVVKRLGESVYTFDFTDFRGKDIHEDLKRRDFTINTFCLDLTSGQDVSLPSAVKDLNAKTIRMVSAHSFKDDPLRLMRAFSLSATTGFKIDVKTKARIKADIALINKAAMERIREELFKILQSPRAYSVVMAMQRMGLLERIVPQVTVMFGVKQGGYHHLDVWRHSLEVLRFLEELYLEFDQHGQLKNYLDEEIGGAHTRRAVLKLSALLHDIGKPQTAKKEGARMTFHGHEHVGEKITRLVAKRLMVTVKERYFLENTVRMHLRPGYLSNVKMPSARMMFRYMRDTKTEAAAIAMLAMADQRATQGPLTTKEKNAHHDKICRMIIAEYFKEKVKPVREKLLSGHDLIKTLKLKPSPLFTTILTAVEEAQALGKIKTKAEALQLAKTLLP